MENNNNNVDVDVVFIITKFSHDNTAHDEERREELKLRDISSQDELVDAGRHNSSKADKNDPDGWWHQEKAS